MARERRDVTRKREASEMTLCFYAGIAVGIRGAAARGRAEFGATVGIGDVRRREDKEMTAKRHYLTIHAMKRAENINSAELTGLKVPRDAIDWRI